MVSPSVTARPDLLVLLVARTSAVGFWVVPELLVLLLLVLFLMLAQIAAMVAAVVPAAGSHSRVVATKGLN